LRNALTQKPSARVSLGGKSASDREGPQSHIKHFTHISLYIFLNKIPLTHFTDT